MKVFHERILDENTFIEWHNRGFDARPAKKYEITNEQSDAIKKLVDDTRESLRQRGCDSRRDLGTIRAWATSAIHSARIN